MCFRF